MVGLPADILDRQPQVLSGGQRQRVAIARALAAEPQAIILDEPTSALDVSVQARVLRLLVDIRERLSLSYLFVTHDLAVARILANRVIVLYKGEIVESGPTSQVLLAPRHRYSQMLSSSLPVISQEEVAIKPEWNWTKKVTAESGSSAGCPFTPRCPYALDVCGRERHPLVTSPTGRTAHCFNPGDDETEAWRAAAVQSAQTKTLQSTDTGRS
jgi:oligopeptide/dipeptide ABC transporter ATP-binding protein